MNVQGQWYLPYLPPGVAGGVAGVTAAAPPPTAAGSAGFLATGAHQPTTATSTLATIANAAPITSVNNNNHQFTQQQQTSPNALQQYSTQQQQQIANKYLLNQAQQQQQQQQQQSLLNLAHQLPATATPAAAPGTPGNGFVNAAALNPALYQASLAALTGLHPSALLTASGAGGINNAAALAALAGLTNPAAAAAIGQNVQQPTHHQAAGHLGHPHHHHHHQPLREHQPSMLNGMAAVQQAAAAGSVLGKLPLLKTPTHLSKESCSAADCVNEILRTGGVAVTGGGGGASSSVKRKFDSGGGVGSGIGGGSAGPACGGDGDFKNDVKKAKLETKALKAKRPGFTDERYNETSYYQEPENGLRKVYPYYFTFTTFTKGRWVGEKILDVFAREFRAHPAEEYERCINAGTLTVNYEKVDVDYRLKHNDLLANIVHRHEVPVSSEKIRIIHMDEDMVVVNKPASIPVHPCGRYRHNTVVFILAKEHGLKNLRTIHRLDRLTSGLLLFGRNPKKAREMEQQIRTRQVQKEYVCRVEGEFPFEKIICKEPIEVVSYKIGVCKVSPQGKECHTEFQRLNFNGRSSVVLCRPLTGRMHQIRVHLQFLGYPVVNDPLYNHAVFGPEKGKGGRIGKTDEQLIQDLISIHNAENWLGGALEGAEESTGGPMGLPIQPSAPKDKEPTPPPRQQPQPQQQQQQQGGQQQQQRSETPDSACDVQSISNSADSPSSNTSGPTTDFNSSSNNVGAEVKPKSVASTSAAATAAAAASAQTTIATQTGIDEADERYDPAKLSVDPHCYECKVKYRDPRPKDLVMFLHAWKYSGHDWMYQTDLPGWAQPNWQEEEYAE